MLWVFGCCFLLLLNICFGIEQKISLNSENDQTWSFYATKNTSLKGYGNVPGDIYTDLWRSNIISDPLKDSNDVAYAWIGKTDWSYSRNFEIPSDALNASQIRLNFAGLDTIASVYINNIFVLNSKNQFIDCSVDLKGKLKPSGNTLRIDFTSPVTYAQKQSDVYKAKYGHIVPPDFPLNIQNGEPHPQFVRKAQASFSWNWGPSFPTMGIWKDLWISYSSDPILMKHMSPLITHSPSKFNVQIDVEIFCNPRDPITFTLLSSLPELSIKRSNDFRIICDKSGISKISQNISVPEASVELWWPNGYGSQKLYTLQTNILSISNSAVLSSAQKKIGFRYVELIQDLVDPTRSDKGRHFYFKVNSIPIFLKGSNFIEVSDFPGRDSTFRTKFLLKSAKEANLNALRVWGGGIFEADDFYALADEYGILLWHDMLFACSLYPVDSEYLSNVYAETTTQVQRLRYHPSILVWAGNNENELAIMSGWWYVPNYNIQEVIADYVKLYRDTIGPVVKALDPSRPYLLSSPSNGVVSEEAGGVGSDPNSEMYGDIHFYNEYINLWKDGSYEIPRCATEFGVQSIPSRDTLLSYIKESDYYYSSKSFLDRQHHTGGVTTLLSMTFSHFERPQQCSDQNNLQGCPYIQNNSSFLAPFSYLTQLHQALSMQVQSEHYRRWRGIINDSGKGNTMCALYWQLNDVWAAPSWASIDYNLEWKAIHYFAKRFFAPVIVSLYLDENGLLQAYVVSDKMTNISNAEIKIEMFAWTNGFKPVYTQKQAINVAPLASTAIKIDTGFASSLSTAPSDFIIRGTLSTPSDGNFIAPTAILHPDKFWNLSNFGKVSISNFKKIDSKTYEVSVAATSVAPFVWIDLTPEFKQRNPFIGFRFSDNAFTTTNPTTIVQLLFEIPPNAVTVGDISVCQLLTCFR
uniref:Beta-mannosidase n=1 Tax=Panagrolaimus davidi TaxID=227884 RepID=A0A914PVZ6_9BILA